MPDSLGWPFLVAAGRHRDYSTLLAPDFLVADLDFGVLDEVARPTSGEDRPTVVGVRTRAGRQLTVAYATHMLTGADLEPASSRAPFCDEYGRPLRLIYGFVSRQAIAEPSAEDLRTAYDVAIAVYRRFLRDEDALTVVSGQSFPLRSRSGSPAPAPSAGGLQRRHRSVTLAIGAVAAALAATVIITAMGARRPSPAACPTASAQSIVTDHPAPELSASCPPSPEPLPS